MLPLIHRRHVQTGVNLKGRKQSIVKMIALRRISESTAGVGGRVYGGRGGKGKGSVTPMISLSRHEI